MNVSSQYNINYSFLPCIVTVTLPVLYIIFVLGLSEVQDELVMIKKYPPGAVVILTRTPSRSDDDFRRKYPELKFSTCEEWIERFYKVL